MTRPYCRKSSRSRPATPRGPERHCPACGTYRAVEDFRFGLRLRTLRVCRDCRTSGNANVVRLVPRDLGGEQQHPAYLFLLALAQRRHFKGKEGYEVADEMAQKILKMSGRAAAIVAKTYVAVEEEFELADDRALRDLRDRLDEFDPTVIERNLHKTLAKVRDTSGSKPSEKSWIRIAKFPDRLAAIVGKTRAVLGDAWKLEDGEALRMIHDLIDEIDDALIEKHKVKRLRVA